MAKKTEEEHNRQLERLIELEGILWAQVKENQKDNKFDITLLRLYSDTSFKVLRHNAIYNKSSNNDDDKCILDNLIYDNKNKTGKRKS
jgi:hypothetical protein